MMMAVWVASLLAAVVYSGARSVCKVKKKEEKVPDPIPNGGAIDRLTEVLDLVSRQGSDVEREESYHSQYASRIDHMKMN